MPQCLLTIYICCIIIVEVEVGLIKRNHSVSRSWLGLLKTTSSSTLIKPANFLSIDAGLVLLLLWIPFYRVPQGLPLCVVLSANLTMGNHLDEILSSSASSIHELRI